MTTRSDISRIKSTLAVLAVAPLEEAWDRTAGWEHGPRKAPEPGERGGGGGEAGAEDRKAEAKMRNRAAEHHRELRGEVAQLDRVMQSVLRRVDIACPPHVDAIRSRQPDVVAADVAAAGYCRSCWRNDDQMVKREKDKRDMFYYRDFCRWCGQFKAKHGIEPPLALLQARHDGRSISPVEAEKAIKDAMPKRSKKKSKRKKSA